ncbi:MAG TPA: hypothetical protein VMT12_12775 [Syntrophales bacterium]|nr:hypothetical protein [Syntrophales bacterium]
MLYIKHIYATSDCVDTKTNNIMITIIPKEFIEILRRTIASVFKEAWPYIALGKKEKGSGTVSRKMKESDREDED